MRYDTSKLQQLILDLIKTDAFKPSSLIEKVGDLAEAELRQMIERNEVYLSMDFYLKVRK